MTTQLMANNRHMTTLGEVSEKVDEMSKKCFDRTIKTKDVTFNHLESVKIGSEEHPLRSAAQQEIAFRLGIPIQYLRKCPEELQKRNMNYWMERERNEELFFRFDGADVRAIFTPRYLPVDNFELLERLDSLGYGPDTQGQCHIDPEFMLLNIPDISKTFEIGKGDTMTPGLSLSNSEVGRLSVTVAAYLWRLVCSNGLISTTSISNKYRHVSRRILDEFPDALANVSDELITQKRQLQFSLESPVSDPMATLASFNRQFQLGIAERDAVEWAWPLEIGPAMFHIVQTYTRAAQFESLSAESSYKLQRVGGLILGMVSKN